jgi:hypothetical protein
VRAFSRLYRNFTHDFTPEAQQPSPLNPKENRMRITKPSLATVAAAAFAAVLLAAPSARGQTTAINTGSLGAAGNGVNSAGVTLGLPGPLTAPGDTAAGYFNPSTGSGTINTQVPYNAALNPSSSGPFTIEFWANPSVTTDDAVGPCPVFNRVSAGNRSGWVFYQRAPTTGWDFRMYDGNGSNVGVDLSGGTNAVGTWSHIVATWDGTTASLYDNGSLVLSKAGVYNSSTSAILSIGTYDNGANAYNGLVDELAIYGTALSASQILAHYNAASSSAPGAYSSLVHSDGAIEYLQQAVPEPSTLALLGVGAVGMLGYVWRQRRR